VRQQLRRFGRGKDFYPVLLAGRNRLGRIGLRVGCRGRRQFHASGRTRHLFEVTVQTTGTAANGVSMAPRTPDDSAGTGTDLIVITV
jgi:hypothetical protein